MKINRQIIALINYLFQIIIFFNIINFSIEKYITIPFKIIHKEEPDSFSTLNDYFNYWTEIEFYGEISIGIPPQKILTKLNFEDFGISFLNKGCSYNTPSSDINNSLNIKNSSTSFNISSDFFYGTETFYYKSFYDAFYATDNFYFDSINYKQKENKEKIKIDNLKFIYSSNDNKKFSTCLNIGFKAYCRNIRESSLNFITQINKLGIINNYDWSVIFDNKKKYLDNGIFLIGAKRHEYNPDLYDEKDLFNSGSVPNEIIPYFNFKINGIYFQPTLNQSDKYLLLILMNFN